MNKNFVTAMLSFAICLSAILFATFFTGTNSPYAVLPSETPAEAGSVELCAKRYFDNYGDKYWELVVVNEETDPIIHWDEIWQDKKNLKFEVDSKNFTSYIIKSDGIYFKYDGHILITYTTSIYGELSVEIEDVL
jgi:hypothetical protein